MPLGATQLRPAAVGDQGPTFLDLFRQFKCSCHISPSELRSLAPHWNYEAGFLRPSYQSQEPRLALESACQINVFGANLGSKRRVAILYNNYPIASISFADALGVGY